MTYNNKTYNPVFRKKNHRTNKHLSQNFEPSIQDYLSYLELKKRDKNNFLNLFKEFELSKVNLERAKFEEFVQYLVDNKRIHGNRELYTHLINVLDYFASNNLLHIDKKNNYKKFLNKNLYSDNEEYQTRDFKSNYIKVDYTQYRKNDDFRVVYSNQLLNELCSKGGEIYLSNNNKILLKLSKNDELKEYPKRTAEAILTREFKFKVKITDEVLAYNDINIEGFIFKSTSYQVNNTKITGDYDV